MAVRSSQQLTLHSPLPSGSGGTQDLGHSFFQYGPPGQWKTDILFSTLLRWKGLNVYNKESSRYPNPRIVLLCLK